MTMTRAYNVVMHDVTSVKVKQEALEAMKTKEMQMAHEIDRVVKAGQLALDDEEEAVQGCGAKFFCGMLGRRRRAAAAQAQAQAQAGSASGEHRAHTGMDARLFGQRGKTATAADRLNHAAESVEAHAGQLGERVRALRAHDLSTAGGEPTLVTWGFNYRMTEIQAALGNSQLKKLDRYISKRNEIADFYRNKFHDFGWLEAESAYPNPSTRSIYFSSYSRYQN